MMRRHSFKLRGTEFKGNVQGRLFTEGGVCLECTDSGRHVVAFNGLAHGHAGNGEIWSTCIDILG